MLSHSQMVGHVRGWLVYVYLYSYAKIVPIGHSFDLEKECLESS